MIDIFTLALSHGLIALGAWRLAKSADLDRDPPEVARPATAESIRRD